MTPIEFPQSIDEPPYVLLWRVDDIAMPAIGVAVGIAVDHLWPGLAVGILLMIFYRRFREGRPEMYVLHALYWFGFIPTRSYLMPNPFCRSFYP